MAKFESEMRKFSYKASLHIDHPKRPLLDVSERLGLTPRGAHSAGDPRSTPTGSLLQGVYTSHHWWCDLRTEDQEDITDFLRRILSEFAPSRRYLSEIAETGGEVCLFIGAFSSGCCAHEFDRQLLADLASTGLNLRIDFYGGEPSDRAPATEGRPHSPSMGRGDALQEE